MKNKFLKGLTILGLTAVLFTSCSKAPKAEIDAANSAIEDANIAGADLYIHDTFVSLQDSMKAVMVTIEEQESKLIKNYSSAKESLAGVTEFAHNVKIQAEARKEEVKVEVQKSIEAVNALVSENKALLLQAPKGKEGTSALMAIKAELTAIETLMTEVNTIFTSGEYMAALNKVKSANEKATAINVELTEVIAKYKGKR